MRFDALFSQTVSDYKLNYKPITKAVILFFGIPVLIGVILKLLLLTSTGFYDEQIRYQEQFSENISAQEVIPFIKKALLIEIPSILGNIIGYLLLVLVFAGIIALMIHKKQIIYAQLVAQGKKYFTKNLKVTIAIFIPAAIVILIVALLVLGAVNAAQNDAVGSVAALGTGAFLVFIIGMIISLFYYISWSLAPYIAIGENKAVRTSLKESSQRLYQKKWRILGYMILVALIMFCIGLALGIIMLIVNALVVAIAGHNPITLVFQNEPLPLPLGIITELISACFTVIGQAITTPLFILFFKNVYLAIKKEGSKA